MDRTVFGMPQAGIPFLALADATLSSFSLLDRLDRLDRAFVHRPNLTLSIHPPTHRPVLRAARLVLYDWHVPPVPPGPVS